MFLLLIYSFSTFLQNLLIFQLCLKKADLDPALLTGNNIHSQDGAFNVLLRCLGINVYEMTGDISCMGNAYSKIKRCFNELHEQEHVLFNDVQAVGDLDCINVI